MSLCYYKIVDGRQGEVQNPYVEIIVVYNVDSYHDDTPKETSVASVKCVQPNRNEDNKIQGKKIIPKYQLQNTLTHTTMNHRQGQRRKKTIASVKKLGHICEDMPLCYYKIVDGRKVEKHKPYDEIMIA